MRSMLHRPKIEVCRAVVCAAILLAAAATLLLALGVHRSERKASPQRNATAAQRTGGAAADNDEPVLRARAVASYGRLPLSFEANRGQTDRRVKFLARGSGYSLFLTGNEAVLSLKKSGPRSQESGPAFRAARLGPAAFRQRQGSADLFSKSAPFPAALLPTADQFKDSFVPSDEARIPDPESQAPAVLRMKLVGANPHAKVSGLEELPGKSNYFIGNDPKKWRTNVPNYAKAKYANVYPGVDLVYYGNQGQLEYDFVLQPGADPRAIQLGFAGATFPRIDGNGDLVLGTGGGEVIFHKPVVYQPANDEPGTRDVLEGNYVIRDHEQVTFEVANYDRARSLVIDPTLAYTTYLGGSAKDYGSGIAVDASGNAYVTGQTFSSDFPTTAGAFQTTYGGNGNAFVSKLNATGSALVYSTYLGGSGGDSGSGIAVDALGNAYVIGSTSSSDFPTTAGALQTTYGGGQDAFVSKLNATGSALVYSTYLGGSDYEEGNGIAIDASGNAYATGDSRSSDFPTTPGAFQTTCKSCPQYPDAFVSKLNAAGSAMVYSTYLGGNTYENYPGWGRIAVDASGRAYVSGLTDSSNFPTTAGAFQTTLTGLFNVFVSKFNAAGSALLYSTYLGGSASDYGLGIAVDATGNAYVTGSTYSSDFPTTAGAFQTAYGGSGDAFVSKLNAAGSTLLYSTYLGGSDFDLGFGIAVNASGNGYFTGYTQSSNFPTTPGAFQTTSGGGRDAIFSKLNSAGSALLYSTYLGGSNTDQGSGIAIDDSGNAYVSGTTNSSNFPTTPGAFQTTLGGPPCGRFPCVDAFVSKFSFPTGGGPVVTLAPARLTFASQPVGTFSPTQQATLTNTGGAALKITSLVATGDFAFGCNCRSTLAAGASCTLNLRFFPTSAPGTRQGTVTITDNAPGSPHKLQLSGTASGSGSIILALSPPSLDFGSVVVGSSSAPQSVTVTNNGTVAASFMSPFGPRIRGTDAMDFQLASQCGTSLAPQASCTVEVTFKPTASGARTGVLAVRQGEATVRIPISGTGT